MRRATQLALAFSLLTLGLVDLAVACPKTSLPAIEQEVTCPVCGTPLAISGGPQAERERVFIRNLIEQCKSKEQIKLALRSQYGPEVLAIPEQKGFGLAAYIIPIVVVIVGLLGVLIGAWRWRRRGRQKSSKQPSAPITNAEQARLDEDLGD